ncbi:hypothetical protein J5N97_019625 [Dioscorea zingiberensis]|uniref:BHLH domain-containing protein n=1 Tax=Dioscorea zingiberensis TaxID=325984 RepID=A0A9D5CEC3_9LILI|nr:hypothetical protein J5N97_019625 [Dioscorea zingiberensis]
MQSDPRFLTGNSSPTDAYEVGGYTHLGGHDTYGTYATPPFGPSVPGRKHDFRGPMINGFEFQPLETCPKNFIIFDQTDNKGRVMFHPALAQNFNYPSLDIHPALAHDYGGNLDKNNDNQGKLSSSLKEDTEEIDALLSSEEEEDEDDEDDEDDVISTGRTPGNWRCNSRYSSSSTECSKSRKANPSSSCQNSFSSSACSSERKRERMRKMVKTLRGIIPGGDHLDTPAVLDEAVRYLKSLKMEAKKLGIQNLEE